MAGNVTGLHQFANDVGPVPLSLLDGNFSALNIALNTLSTFSTFYVDQGTTNGLTVTTPATQFVSYTDGLQVSVRVANTNTGPATLNVNTLGPAPIQNPNGTSIAASALLAGSVVSFVYNAPRNAWQLATGAGGGGGGGSGFPFTGNAVMTGVAGGAALQVNGVGQDTAVVITSGVAPAGAPTNVVGLGIDQGNQTVPGQWAQTIWGTTNPGMSNGLQIQAGTNASDYPLLVKGANGTTLFSVSGNGTIYPSGGGGGGGFPPTVPAVITGPWTFNHAGPATYDQATITINGAADPQDAVTALVCVAAVAPAGAAQNAVGLGVELGSQTTPNQWAMSIWGYGGATTPTVTAGCSNGLSISAGTNASDYALMVKSVAGTTLFSVRGDGTIFPAGGGGGGSGTVTSVATGVGLTGGPITTTGTIALANTAVTPGNYTSTNLTVDAQGRITAASSGTGGGVTQLIAGSNVTLSPSGGTGIVTISSVAGGGGSGSWPPTPPSSMTGTLTINGQANQTSLVLASALATAGAAQNVVGLAITLGAQTTPNQWAAHIWGGGATAPTAGCSNGLWVSAGTNASDYAMIVGPNASTSPTNLQYFTIRGDGSGFLGPNFAGSLGLKWDANAKFTFSTAAFTTPNQWQWQIGSATTASGSTAGNSNALQVNGGLNSNDYALQVNGDGNGQQFCYMKGDGSGFIGNGTAATPHGMQWTGGATPVFSLVGGATATFGGGATTLAGLTDVTIASQTTGQVLTWNGTHWANLAAASGLTLPATLTNAGPPPGLEIATAHFTTQGEWLMQLRGGTSVANAADCSNGLFLAAGTTANDSALWVTSDDTATTYLQILGNGDIFIPGVHISTAAPNTVIDVTTGRLTRSTVAAPTVTTGTFNGTLTGMTAAVTVACKYTLVSSGTAGMVVLQMASANGTSNATSMTMTGVPAAITPATAGAGAKLPYLYDNGASADGSAYIDTTGTITFVRGVGVTNTTWTASGAKGLQSTNTLVYSLQ